MLTLNVIVYRMFIVCFILSVLLAETSASTCPEGEISCSNGTCISEEFWCDGEMDCPDGSDEQFCYGTKCLDGQFTCDNRRCVPIESECNGYDDCGDGSDEYCVTGRRKTIDSALQLSVVQAVHSLLIKRNSDYGWDEFTPRALVALAFGQKHQPISDKEKSLMMKRFDLQILLFLKENVHNLATLAHNINALYAMCKDPRDFHGLDLVELLRSRTDEAMTPDFNLPIVLLTLCLANETIPEDFEQLLRIYEDTRNNRIGVKALALIAMFACSRQDFNRRRQSEIKMDDFLQLSLVHDGIDTQSRALICQAYNAYGYDSSFDLKKLMKTQSEDGTFGDLLGIYSAIPALLNSSLADLQCKTRHYEDSKRRQSSSSAYTLKPESQIDYSLWISNGEKAGNHTLRLSYEGDKTFYDLMKMAEQKNKMYRFKYDELEGTGKKIYYLAGIPNDAEKGYSWNLYRQVTRDAVNSMSIKKDGVDRIYPADGEHFIFQLDHIM